MRKLASNAPPPCPEDADAWRAYQSFLKRMDAIPEHRRVEVVGNAVCAMIVQVLQWMPQEDLPAMAESIIHVLQAGVAHAPNVTIHSQAMTPSSEGMH